MTYTPIPRGTQNWDVPLNAALSQLDSNITSASGTALQAANNLSDLTNKPQARINLGLTGLANALSNMTATINPAVTSDNTQGYSIGSTWFNTTTNAMFVASSVATGAAVWLQIPPTFVDRTTSQTVAGVKTFTSQINVAQTGDTNAINATYTALNGSNAAFAHTAFGATARTIDGRVTGDTFGRFAVFANGNLEWGAGNIARDVNLYRAGVNLLQTDDSLSVLGNMSAANFPSGAWTSWTPTWTTSSGANTPTFGNAVVDCMYTKIGRTVLFRFDVTFGSTTNFNGGGTGDNWLFSLPFTAAHTSATIGHWSGRPGGSTSVMGDFQTGSSATVMQMSIDSGAPNATAITNVGVADAQSPFVWANGNAIRGTGFYEATS